MNTLKKVNETMTKYRWVICTLLFFATTINYLDRQVMSLLADSLKEEFHWTDTDYGVITFGFMIAYGLGFLFAGRFIDKLGVKKGYAIAIIFWSVAACLHATCGILTGMIVDLPNAEALRAATDPEIVATIAFASMLMFVAARVLLALGESGNFPAAIKTTAEYFPKRDRAYATGIFNSGANIGAIIAPLSIVPLADWVGWEAAFLIIGATGFIWLIFWLKYYKPIHENEKMNEAEKAYILQDYSEEENQALAKVEKVPYLKCLKYRQTWLFAVGKFLTDGVWWFFLFWIPLYLSAEYGMKGTAIMLPIAVLYTISTVGSVLGGKLPTLFMNKGMDPYAGRMKAMLIIAVFPLVVLLAQPFGHVESFGNSAYWVPIIVIGIGGAAHQAWSANIFSTVGDMFPKKAIGTITGIGGTAGAMGAAIITLGSGVLLDYSEATWGSKTTGYTIIFSFCAVAYILAWIIMKCLVPRYKQVEGL